MRTFTKPLSLQKQRQSKGSLSNKTRSHNTYSPSRLPPMLLYKIQPWTKCQNSEKGSRSLHESWGSRNWRHLALEHRKRIYNLMQQKALDRFVVLTPRTSPNPPHVDPLALQKKFRIVRLRQSRSWSPRRDSVQWNRSMSDQSTTMGKSSLWKDEGTCLGQASPIRFNLLAQQSCTER